MKGFSTKAIHIGEIHLLDSVTTPIFQTSNFLMSAEKYESNDRNSYIYSRMSNPTVRMLEKKLAALCNGEDGVLLSSGMAAISCSLLSVLSKNDRVIFSAELYGGTYAMIREVLSKFCIKCDFTPVDELNHRDFSDAKVVFVESLTNPLLKLADIDSLAKKAHEQGALLYVDNTFMSPYNFRPLKFGADVEIHSLTKYVGGHSDIILGFVTARHQKLIEKIWRQMYTFGANPNPFEAFLTARSVKTLSLRMTQHNKNAEIIVDFLLKHPKIKEVRYPSLQQNIPECYKDCPGFGGVIYIDLETTDNALRFASNLKLFRQATSLAGVESLVTIPCLTSHSALNDEELQKAHISKGGVRLSVGIEDVQDLLEDLSRALNKI